MVGRKRAIVLAAFAEPLGTLGIEGVAAWYVLDPFLGSALAARFGAFTWFLLGWAASSITGTLLGLAVLLSPRKDGTPPALPLMFNLSLSDILGKRVLIVGERGRGKTLRTALLLRELLKVYKPEDVTIIDMAPTTLHPGSRLSGYIEGLGPLRYLSPRLVRAPRIEGRDAGEVLALAKLNAEAIDPLLDEYLSKPTALLVVNDLTIYLHAGSLEKAARCALTAETFLANAYRGSSLTALDKGSGLSERERETLSMFIDLVKAAVIEL